MKLIYFDMRGRAEAIRFILAAAGVEYEDKRITFAEWAALKSDMPWGQIPVLETVDGTILAQSVTIARYLARKYKLVGATDLEAAKCDEIVDAFGDLMKDWVDFIWVEKNEEMKAEKKKKFTEVTVVTFLAKLNSIVKANGGTFLVGRGLTWADIFIGSSLEAIEITTNPTLLEGFPEIVNMRNAVINQPNIKAWIDKRPPEDLLGFLKSR